MGEADETLLDVKFVLAQPSNLTSLLGECYNPP